MTEIVDSLVTELGFTADTKVLDKAEKQLKAVEKSAKATATAVDALADEQINLAQKVQNATEKEQKLRREQAKLNKEIKKSKNPTQAQVFALKKVDRQLEANSRAVRKYRNDLAQLGIQQSRLAKQGRIQGRQQSSLGGAVKGAKDRGLGAATEGGGLEGIAAAATPVTAALAGVAAAATVAGVAVATVVETGARMELLRARLKTVEGSVEKATAAFSLLKDLATETPFELEDVTSAYVRLKSVGIQPTEKSLKAFGNVAAAQGKPILDAIEAVTDATTGEFERLKEFGIKASSQGDKVAFTFAGMTTTVGKNAKEIEKFLVGLGETKFAGAMSDQMSTFGGLLSNLKDGWTSFLDQIAQLGVLDEAKLLLKELSGTIGEDLAPIIADILVAGLQQLREIFVFVRESGGGVKATLEGLFETIKLIGTLLAPFIALWKALVAVTGLMIEQATFLHGILNGLFDLLGGLFDLIKNLLTPTSELGGEWTVLGDAWSTATTFGNDLLATVMGITNGLIGQAGSMSSVNNAIKEFKALTGDGLSALSDKELQALRKKGGTEGEKAEAEIRKRIAKREKAEEKTAEAATAKKAKEKKAGRAGDVASRFDKLSDRQLASFASDPNVSKKLRDKAEKEQLKRNKKRGKKGAAAGKKLRDATLVAEINKQIDKNARELARAETARGLRSKKLTSATAGAFETKRFKEIGDKQRGDFETSGKLPAGIAQDIRQAAALPSINDLAGRTQAPVISNTIIKTEITGNTFTAEISGAFATSPAEAVTLSLMEFRKQSGKLMAEAVPMFRTQELR